MGVTSKLVHEPDFWSLFSKSSQSKLSNAKTYPFSVDMPMLHSMAYIRSLNNMFNDNCGSEIILHLATIPIPFEGLVPAILT